ncbi:MAG: hypothetical protein KatS3mg038_2771 [Candidatus Kapaibacterium sp.]|nr:MAG: hypothetical protein KatS3mg038_2771 [Candidatus Kapabacteria bacterium]
MITIDTCLAPAICSGRTFEIREPLRDLFAPPATDEAAIAEALAKSILQRSLLLGGILLVQRDVVCEREATDYLRLRAEIDGIEAGGKRMAMVKAVKAWSQGAEPPQEWVDTLQLNMYTSSHDEGVIVVFEGATFKTHHYAYHYDYNRVHKMLSRLDAYARAVLLSTHHQEVLR